MIIFLKIVAYLVLGSLFSALVRNFAENGKHDLFIWGGIAGMILYAAFGALDPFGFGGG